MTPDLDAIFAALADPTRRGIVRRLADGEAQVAELAAPFAISAPAISRHLRVLETAGLIARRVEAQRRIISLNPDALRAASRWVDHYRHFWDGSLDRLEAMFADDRRGDTPNPNEDEPDEQTDQCRD
jgi:DNA-binding transcriptional ArsR family regulator